MSFELGPDQEALRAHAHEFATRVVLPEAAALDREARWPREILAQMAELGFLGLCVPTEYGGAGLDSLSYAVVIEELSRACASTGVITSVNNSLFCDPLLEFGSEAQKNDILRPTASGAMLGAFALTEPASGSDARTMKTTAVDDGGGAFVLNGSKNFITCGPEAAHILVFAVTKPDPARPEHTAFIVPRDTKGFSLSHHDDKLGIRAAHSCSIFLEDVRIPKELVLGEVGRGFKIAMHVLDGGRIGIAAQALGIARAALEEAVEYAKQRQAFGGSIANFQAIQFMIADMATRLDAARLLTFRAASMKDAGKRHTVESAMAKLAASEMATFVTHRALQIHGGYGYTKEYAAERHVRDARITEIYEGTSEIQRLVIGGGLLR